MTETPIPEHLRQFILDKFDSIAQLEGLLLFCENPGTLWNIESLSKRLYIDKQQADQVLSHLYTEGFLVEESESFRYQTSDNEVHKMVCAVTEAYSKYLVYITNLIHSKPQTRINEFADAFRLRKRKDT
jgi:hypothetical protein